MEKLSEIMLISKAEQYLKLNPERFTNAEKEKFKCGLAEWIAGTSETIDDEIYDFLVSLKFDGRRSREEEFASHIMQNYSNIQFRKIMDVGAGRMCKLSSVLAKCGYKMYAIDPNIRLLSKEAGKLKISSMLKNKFVCDDLALNGKGTNIQNYDLIVGLEPCDATEHVIRQAIKFNKPFEILLCASQHDGLDGTKFKTYLEWYEHLKGISSEVKITRKKNSYFASNVSEKEF